MTESFHGDMLVIGMLQYVMFFMDTMTVISISGQFGCMLNSKMSIYTFGVIDSNRF